MLRDLLHALGEALDVHLVDDHLVPRAPGPLVTLPIKRRIDHDRLGDRRRIVFLITHQISVILAGNRIRMDVGRRPVHGPVDRQRVRVDQQLVGVEPISVLRRPRPLHPVAISLARADTRQIAVPMKRRALAQRQTRLGAIVVEQTQLDAFGVLGEQRKIRSLPVPRRARRQRLPGQHLNGQRRSVLSHSILYQR